MVEQNPGRGYQKPEQHAGSGERVASRSGMATRGKGGESAALRTQPKVGGQMHSDPSAGIRIDRVTGLRWFLAAEQQGPEEPSTPIF